MGDTKFCSQEEPKLGIFILGRGQRAFEKLDFEEGRCKAVTES